MHWFTAFVLYVIIWWTVLFAVLPVGTRPVADADAATGWRGAPAKPMIGRKVLATTLIAALLWGGAMLVIQSGWVSFRSGWLALPDQ
jgi:predicted secreted protein